MKTLISSLLLLLVLGCKTTTKIEEKSTNASGYGSPTVKQELVNDQMFLIKEFATNETYGFTPQNPIMVGKEGSGPLNQRRFLNALAGPKGEVISYDRLGSCCAFYTKNGFMRDAGLLDKYKVTYPGLSEPKIFYINMYDSDVLQVPVGFTLKYK